LDGGGIGVLVLVGVGVGATSSKVATACVLSVAMAITSCMPTSLYGGRFIGVVKRISNVPSPRICVWGPIGWSVSSQNS